MSTAPSQMSSNAGVRLRWLSGRRIIAYLLACLGVTVLLPVSLLARDMVALGPKAALAAVAPGDIIAILAIGFLFITLAAAPFAMALLALAHALRRHTLPVFAAGGAVIGPIVGLIAGLMHTAEARVPGVTLAAALLYAVLGLIGGCVFWRLGIRQRPRAGRI